MNDFKRPAGSDLDRLREAFAEIAAAEALLRPTAQSSRRRVAASRIYAAARDGSDDQDVSAVLADNRAARALYGRAVADTARFALPEARAASSGNPAARYGEGCHIRFERSRAEPGQYFVVVEVASERDDLRSPTSLIVCDREQRCRQFPLPAVRDGIAQIIAEADSDLVRLVGDPTTRVYLR